MNNMPCILTTMIVVFGLLGVLPGNALSVKMKSMRSAFTQADVVLLLKIESKVEYSELGIQCGTRYRATPVEVFKADSDYLSTKRFIFGNADGLEPGKEYLLFLDRINDAKQRLRQIEAKIRSARIATRGPILSEQQKLSLITCHGLIPGYQFDDSIAWPIRDGNVSAFGLWTKADIPSSIKITRDGPEWMLDANDVFRYFRNLDKSMAQHKKSN